MRKNKVEGRFGIELDALLGGFDGIRITIAAVLDHEYIRIQIQVHLVSIGETKANVPRIAVKEDNGGYVLRLGIGMKEEPRVHRDTVFASNHVTLERDVVL